MINKPVSLCKGGLTYQLVNVDMDEHICRV